ncbi:MATE family efflux transporter (plasmid) [Enterococcus faecium]|uniref:MATE family efflux transporter n=1 Tax=Enterococcus TaxID=1350 RepID=UPI000E66DA5D|nr:MATE family efflux transporter [Enterococcus faecium]AYA33150.1 MATE family efflux transporter [Enterococcus faecium]EGO5824465.1 MATE family efflux transporter [Enterococcus faecalis]
MDNINKGNTELGTEKISRLIIKYAIPSVVGLLTNAIYAVEDKIFIGNSPEIGAEGLAAITVAFPVTNIMTAVATLLGVGGAILFSREQGKEGSNKTAGEVLGTTISSLIFAGILTTVFGLLFLTPLLKVFGAGLDVLPYAKPYMAILLIGSSFNYLSLGLNGFVVADGKPKLAMYTSIIGSVGNIILDYVLIVQLNAGLIGAGLTNVIGQAFVTMVYFAYFISKKSKTRLILKNMRIRLDYIKNIVKFGFSSSIIYVLNAFTGMVMNQAFINYGDDLALSGYGIVNSVQYLLILPLYGIVQGVQPIFAYNMGAELWSRVKDALKIALSWSLFIGVLVFAATRLWPESLVAVFTDSQELRDVAAYMMAIWMIGVPVIGIQTVGASFYQTLGQPIKATLLSSTRQFIVLVPMLFVLPQFFGFNGVLSAMPITDYISSSITLIFLVLSYRRLNERQEEKTVVKLKSQNTR